jgi:hypothetical protein
MIATYVAALGNELKNAWRSFAYVVTETYFALCCIVLCELGCRAKCPRRSGACGRFERRGTQLNGFAIHPTDRLGEPADWQHFAADRHHDSTDRQSADSPWIHFTRWNSEHNCTWFEFSECSDAWKYHAAVDRQPQHHNEPRHLAQRFAMRNFARHSQWGVRLHSELGIVEFQSVNLGKPRQ